MVRQDPPGSSRAGGSDRLLHQLGKDGLAYFGTVIGGPSSGWALERAACSLRAIAFSLVKGPRRLEFTVSPEVLRDGAGHATGYGKALLSASHDFAPEDRPLAAEIAAGLAATNFLELTTRLDRDALLYSDADGSRIPSRLDRYFRYNDHSPDFWKFVYLEWRCLERRVVLGAHWARINHATRECRLSNPNPEVVSLRYFADERPESPDEGCISVETIITEADVLGGKTQEMLGATLDRVAREEKPAFIHINTTCMPELIGDTPAPFISRIEEELGVPVFWTSKTRPGGPLYAAWIERLLDQIQFSPERDPRAVLLAGIPSAAAQAEASALCAALGLRVVGTLFPNLDFRRTPEMGAASAVVWLNPVGWETISDGPFLRHGLKVVRSHPPFGLAGTQAWLERISSVLGLGDAGKVCARELEARAGELGSLRKECGRRTVALIGDPTDIGLLTAQVRALGFSLARLLGELGFNVRCLVHAAGAKELQAALRRPRAPLGAGTIEFVPFSTRAQLDRQLERGIDLAFSHLNHDARLGAHGLLGFTEAAFEPGFDGLLRSGRRLLPKCRARPFPRHHALLSPWTT